MSLSHCLYISLSTWTFAINSLSMTRTYSSIRVSIHLIKLILTSIVTVRTFLSVHSNLRLVYLGLLNLILRIPKSSGNLLLLIVRFLLHFVCKCVKLILRLGAKLFIELWLRIDIFSHVDNPTAQTCTSSLTSGVTCRL